jgi:hypothetical protein
MDTNSDDLSDVERRLAACEPSAAGLDADAMLFAAGRASVRPSAARVLWPLLTACLAALVVVLGAWLWFERAERLSLAGRLQQSAPAPAPAPVPPPEPPTAAEPPTSSVFAGHRALEQGLDAWPPAPLPDAGPPGPLPPDPPILRVGRSATLPDL